MVSPKCYQEFVVQFDIQFASRVVLLREITGHSLARFECIEELKKACVVSRLVSRAGTAARPRQAQASKPDS
jgi:hypothetical protein